MKNSITIFVVLTLLIGLFFNSCANQQVDGPSLIPVNELYIEYINVNAENILQLDSQIGIFYHNNGTHTKIEQANLDYPNGYSIETVDTTGNLYLHVFTGNFLSKENNLFYVDFNSYPRDTFRCEYQDSGLFSKIWHNNKLIWDYEEIKELGPDGIVIQIVK